MAGSSIVRQSKPATEALWGTSIKYFDYDNGFLESTQAYAKPRSVFETTRSVQKRLLNSAATMSAAQALGLAIEITNRSVAELDIYQFTVGPKFWRVTPGDMIAFPYNGETILGTVREVEENVDRTLKLAVTGYLAQTAVTVDPSTITVDYVELTPFTKFTYLNGPLLADADESDNKLREYAAIYGSGTSWAGGALWRSTDADNYTMVGDVTNEQPVMGKVKTISGTPDSTDCTDTENSIAITIMAGDSSVIETITNAQYYNGVNRAMIGAPGRWVMVYFRDASLSGSVLTISHLLWGVRGTEVHIDYLVVGDEFHFLDPDHYRAFRSDVDEIGDEIYYKAFTGDDGLLTALVQIHSPQGNAEKPYAPVQLDAVVDGADIDLSWVWRVRRNHYRTLTGNDGAYSGEDSLAFEIDIMANGSPSGVVRTLTSTTGSKTYLAAQISTDFGSMPATLTFRVYMMSGKVGRGYMAEATITL